MVDWDLAAGTAGRLVRPGPRLTATEATGVVTALRGLSAEALDHVVQHTGLTPDPALRTCTEVVDRPTWARHNVAGMRAILVPVIEVLAAKRSRPARGYLGGALGSAGRTVTGAELGAVLSLLASRVLGQYEVFLPTEHALDGRLLLVAPNIVEVERRLAVDPRDFRMWVCLHEQTHHAQFTAAPWLRDHLHGMIRELVAASNLDPGEMVSRLMAAARARRGAAGPNPVDEPGVPLAALQSPEQRAVVARLQAVMTLLEGHADEVMDAVGPQVVPSVAAIRSKFEQRRRRGGSPLDRFLRKVLGLDAKLAQYQVGGAFCRAVSAAGGPAAMRRAFAGPEFLPTSGELHEPQAWLERTAAMP
jgi:coenzyme F420 biosynthesis associated uncharacterized protein